MGPLRRMHGVYIRITFTSKEYTRCLADHLPRANDEDKVVPNDCAPLVHSNHCALVQARIAVRESVLGRIDVRSTLQQPPGLSSLDLQDADLCKAQSRKVVVQRPDFPNTTAGVTVPFTL